MEIKISISGESISKSFPFRKPKRLLIHPNIRGRARPFEFTLSVRPRPGFLTARSGRFSIAFRFRWSRLPGRPPPLQRGEQDRNNSAYGAPSQPVPESDGTGGLATFSEQPTTLTFRARTWCFGPSCKCSGEQATFLSHGHRQAGWGILTIIFQSDSSLTHATI